LNKRTYLVVIESKKVYEMERNNLGMMYQHGLEVGLIQMNKTKQKEVLGC